MHRRVGYWKKTQTLRAQIGGSVARDQHFAFLFLLVLVLDVAFDQVAIAEHGSAGGDLCPFPLVAASRLSADSAVEDHDVAEAAVFQGACRVL